MSLTTDQLDPAGGHTPREVHPATTVPTAHGAVEAQGGSALTRTLDELRNVTWLSPSTFLRYTAVVVAFLVTVTTVVALADTALSAAILHLLG